MATIGGPEEEKPTAVKKIGEQLKHQVEDEQIRLTAIAQEKLKEDYNLI